MLPTEIPCKNDGELYDYYLNSNWGSSDIDLFIYGLKPEQIEQKVHFLSKHVIINSKIRHIYEVVTRNLYLQKQNFFLVKSEQVITIVTEFPYRCIQIVNYGNASAVRFLYKEFLFILLIRHMFYLILMLIVFALDLTVMMSGRHQGLYFSRKNSYLIIFNYFI